MTDLSFLSADTTIGRVDAHVAAEAAKEPPRPYLGMSEIGDECSRRLWLKIHTDFREFFSGRMYRLFDTGYLIEKRIVKNLRGAGFKVNRGKKMNSFSDFDGLFRGHSDGIISGLVESGKPHILECKSASDKNFQDFKFKGVATKSPKYEAQVQLYMGYAGLTRALFVIENKNISERIQERVKFDKGKFEMLVQKARMIIEATEPPRGINDNPAWWACKLCPLNNGDWCRKDWEVKREGVPF